MDIDTEELEGFNSQIKNVARFAPNIGADLLSARCNIKSDVGLSTAADYKRPVREMMKKGQTFNNMLLPFTQDNDAIKDVIKSPKRFAHAQLLDNLPTPAAVQASMKICDPFVYEDKSGDKYLNWATAHNAFVHAKLKGCSNAFGNIIVIGDVVPGCSAWLPCDSCNTLHFLTEFRMDHDGRLNLVVPWVCRSSVDILKDRFDIAHDPGYDAVEQVRICPMNWGSWKGSDSGHMSFAAPPPEKFDVICDIVPGRKYVPSEAKKRLCVDAVDKLIEDGSEKMLEDMRDAYSLGGNGSSTLEDDIAAVIEMESREIGEAAVDRREDPGAHVSA
jgi:hypothetical protein